MALHTPGLWTACPRDAKPPAGAALDPSHPLAPSVIGCWMFNEGAGNKAADLGPFGIHLTGGITGTTTHKWWSIAGVTGAGQPTGASGAVGWLGVGGARAQPTKWSFEFRAYSISTSITNGVGIFSFGHGSTFVGTSILVNQTGNVVNVRLGNGSNQTITTAARMPAATLTHLVVTCGGNGNPVSFYVNGKFIDSTTATRDSTFNTDNIALGGGTVGGTGNIWNGPIDYAVFYNRPLTPVEVMDRYRRPYAIVGLPRSVPRVAGASPPPATAYGAALFPGCM